MTTIFSFNKQAYTNNKYIPDNKRQLTPAQYGARHADYPNTPGDPRLSQQGTTIPSNWNVRHVLW
jgi:hypothetical protein